MRDNIIEIHNDDYMLYEDIRFRNIQFFMYAEGGAMGEAGEIRIITKKGENICCYHANCVFGDFKWSNVVHIFPQFDETFDHRNDLFDHVDLGMGNHLFVRKALKKEFDAAFEFKTSRVEMYQQWFDVAKAILSGKKEWKYCVVGNIVHSRIDKSGILRYGTAQFTGGTKVYLCGKYWNKDEDEITVIGLNRRNKYEATDVPVSAIENVRSSRVYKPKVLEIMSNFEFWQRWWDNAPDDKRETEAFEQLWKKYEKIFRLQQFHSYSVKKLLTDYFGEDVFFSMRTPHEDIFDTESCKDSMIPLAWQCADERMLSLFLEDLFIDDSVLEEDHIAYILQRGSEKLVYLMFMTLADEPDFTIDLTYAKELCRKWQEKGYTPCIVSCRVALDYYGSQRDSFRFVLGGNGIRVYKLKKVNGREILSVNELPCWEYYYDKIISVVKSDDITEYECLFNQNVEITQGKDAEKKVIAKGICATREFFLNHLPIYKVYKEYKATNLFSLNITAAGRTLTISVNRENQIAQISVDKLSPSESGVIVDNSPSSYGSLVKRIPQINAVRYLDPKQMHAFVYQIEYEGKNVRNYYLYTFCTLENPQGCEIKGHKFDESVLQSAKTDKEGNLLFSNGYVVPKHILYYRSYRQVVIDNTNETLYNSENIKIETLYKLPLLQFHTHFSPRQYYGFADECFGPKQPWLNENGIRTSEIACVIYEGFNRKENKTVCVEPSGKYGIIKPDGSWLFPPIYDSINREYTNGIFAEKDGRQYLLRSDGAEVLFEFNVGEEVSGMGCYLFNADENAQLPQMEYCYYWYDDYDFSPGKWGIIDSDGKIIVEPKYTIAIGFWNGNDEFCIVAREVKGKLLWGAINLSGEEIIPCIYEDLYTTVFNDGILFFKTEENESYGPYGVMDINGNILLEPQFSYIDEYDKKHRLLSAGKDGDNLGVYSLEKKEMMIAQEYDHIDFGEKMISCEISGMCRDRYFDYEGNELFFGDYDSVSEREGVLFCWKDKKQGIIDWNANEIVPPILGYSLVCSEAELYKRGYLITENNGLCGLSKTNGETIIPELFKEIVVKEDFVIASKKIDGNWDVVDILFDIAGNVLLKGLYRQVDIDTDTQRITMQTPVGIQVLKYYIT